MMVDIKTIPIEKLKKDIADSKRDILVCNIALANKITEYSGGTVKSRLEANKHFVDVITKELNKRKVAIVNRIPQCDNCSHDGKCQYQDLGDCQNCNENINESPI